MAAFLKKLNPQHQCVITQGRDQQWIRRYYFPQLHMNMLPIQHHCGTTGPRRVKNNSGLRKAELTCSQQANCLGKPSLNSDDNKQKRLFAITYKRIITRSQQESNTLTRNNSINKKIISTSKAKKTEVVYCLKSNASKDVWCVDGSKSSNQETGFLFLLLQKHANISNRLRFHRLSLYLICHDTV